MHSPQTRAQAILLREAGYSYGGISTALGISKSTLNTWLKNIDCIHNESVVGVIGSTHERLIKASRQRKTSSLTLAEEYAESQIANLSERDIFLMGMGIYLGEGSKSHGIVRISNADPRVLQFSLIWLRKCFGLTDRHFKVRIHAYPDTDIEAALDFWISELNLPKTCFHPFFIDRRQNKQQKKRRILPHGTAHLTVIGNGHKDHGVLLHRKILATMNRILNMRD